MSKVVVVTQPFRRTEAVVTGFQPQEQRTYQSSVKEENKDPESVGLYHGTESGYDSHQGSEAGNYHGSEQGLVPTLMNPQSTTTVAPTAKN